MAEALTQAEIDKMMQSAASGDMSELNKKIEYSSIFRCERCDMKASFVYESANVDKNKNRDLTQIFFTKKGRLEKKRCTDERGHLFIAKMK